MSLTIPATSTEEVTTLIARAAAAAKIWAATGPTERKQALDAVADRLDNAADYLIPVAMEETNLGEARLRGELKRTTFQLRLFGTSIEEGSYLDVRIDPADPEWPMGVPRPDIRRQLEPLGPVVVFSASNFPFAFSGAGGDTASALAAGCPVILKAHSGHPRLSQATGELVEEALQSVGAPEGVFAVIFGTESGKAALKDPRIKAGSFTGSIPGGRALFDIANSRPEPIPFYGELGSVNPVFITKAAAAARAKDIAQGFLGSFTMSAGQFCTKPGVLFVPERSTLPGLLRTSSLAAPAPLLNPRIQEGFTEILQELMSHPDVQILASSGDALADPPAPSLLTTSIDRLLADPESLFRECFGPAAMVVTYSDESQLLDVASMIDGQLTGTIHGETGDQIAPELIRILATKAGRLLWNQWPTGVSVTYAQQHGGPYPATTASAYTSVGTAAITRFLRPVAYQNFPQDLLPEPLRDSSSGQVPQRINGQAVLPD
jgi:NADP-dependent aldehyde dehydrogenase